MISGRTLLSDARKGVYFRKKTLPPELKKKGEEEKSRRQATDIHYSLHLAATGKRALNED